MLTDPLVIGLKDADNGGLKDDLNRVGTYTNKAETLTFRTVDLAPGKTVREARNAAGDKITLTISHSETKENAPYVTDRAVIRLDHLRVDTNGKPVTQSAYIVVAYPLGSTFTEDECLSILNTVCLFALLGNWNGQGSMATWVPVGKRILEGEP